MKVFLFVLIFALPLPPQDEPRLRDLLRKLDDDSIDVRSASAEALSQMGSETVPELRRAAVGAGPEVRDRLAAIIRKIEERDRLASLLPAPSKISVDATNRPLLEVLRVVAAQSKTTIDIGGFPPDARVSVSLRQVPLWKALEAVCKASGKAMLGFNGDHLIVAPEPYVELPGRITDHFRVTLESLELKSSGVFGQPDRFEPFNATFRICWEKGAKPSRIIAQLLELVDESGTDLVGGGESDGQVTTTIAADMVHTEVVLDYPHGPGPQAQRIPRLKVGIEFQFPLRYAEVKLNVANGNIPVAGECAEFAVKLTHLERLENALMANLSVIPGAMPAEVDLGFEAILLRDKGGKEYPGTVNEGNPANENETAYVVSFPAAPANAVPAEVVVRIPIEIHREKFDVELKDIPLK